MSEEEPPADNSHAGRYDFYLSAEKGKNGNNGSRILKKIRNSLHGRRFFFLGLQLTKMEFEIKRNEVELKIQFFKDYQ